MAKKKHRTTYRKATERLETEGRRQCFIMYSASAIALWRYWGKRTLAISRLFEVTGAIWHDCASTNLHSMIEMCEQETGIEVRNESGKSWRDLPYLNASLDTMQMSNAQWVYMRQQQAKWIAPQVMACIIVALHRKYGFGFDRCARFYGQVESVRAEYNNDPDELQKIAKELTHISVEDTFTRKREA